MLRSILLVLAIIAVSADTLEAQPGRRPIGRPSSGEAATDWQNGVSPLDETPRAPVVGNRVRVTAPEMGLYRVAGSVEEVRADGAILLHPDSGRPQMWIESSDISKLDVSIGQKTNALKGMGIGLLVGGGTGIALGLMSEGDGWFSKGDMMLVMGIAFSVPAALVGGMIGYAHLTDSWAEGRVQSSGPDLYPEIGERGFGVGFRLMAGGR